MLIKILNYVSTGHLRSVQNDANKNKFSTYDESLFEVNKALNLSVQRQQISDVPLGCFFQAASTHL